MSTWTPFQSFWSSPWSASLRAACPWLKRVPGPVVPPTPDALAPNWLRPLCFQRMIGQAILDRIAWLRANPDKAASLHPEDSIPLWTRVAWRPYDRAALSFWTDERLLFLFEIEVERLLLTVRTPPALLSEEVWTRAILGTCEHLAQIYQEYRRRYGARAVRKFVQRVLTLIVIWECPPEPEDAPDEAPASFNEEESCFGPAIAHANFFFKKTAISSRSASSLV